jgi:hypothetical protein
MASKYAKSQPEGICIASSHGHGRASSKSVCSSTCQCFVTSDATNPQYILFRVASTGDMRPYATRVAYPSSEWTTGLGGHLTPLWPTPGHREDLRTTNIDDWGREAPPCTTIRTSNWLVGSGPSFKPTIAFLCGTFASESECRCVYFEYELVGCSTSERVS